MTGSLMTGCDQLRLNCDINAVAILQGARFFMKYLYHSQHNKTLHCAGKTITYMKITLMHGNEWVRSCIYFLTNIWLEDWDTPWIGYLYITGWTLSITDIINVYFNSPHVHVFALWEDTGAVEETSEHGLWTERKTAKISNYTLLA